MKNEQLIFATNNRNKIDEIFALIGKRFHIVTLKEAGIDVDIPEPYNTIEENAATKANIIYKLTGENCFGEDTGLEVDVLNGEPGVRSARYAGEEKNFIANIDKLLLNLEGVENRKANFKTIISLIFNDEEHLFEGIANGTITHKPKGINGFGYDAVFLPDGSEKTFAEMELAEKNKYSHRRKAVDKLIEFLNRQ